MSPLPPPPGQDQVATFSDVRASLPPVAQEVVSARTRDEKRFRLADGLFLAVFGHRLHYEAAPGQWEDVDLNFRQSGSEQVVDRSEVVVRVNDGGIALSDRTNGKGINWLTPTRADVAGRFAKVTDQGLEWQYELNASGAKVTGRVAAARGPRRYEFGYNLVGENPRPLELNDRGDLVGEGFVVPRPTVLGARGQILVEGSWLVLDGQRVAYDLDDSSFAQEAFPYVIDPTTTFDSTSTGVAAVTGYSSTYPPPAGSAVASVFGAGNDYLPGGASNGRVACPATCYATTTGLARWDTSSLPDDAVAFRAFVGGSVGAVDKVNDEALMYSWSPWHPAGNEDLVSNPGPAPAGGLKMSHLKPNAFNEIGFANNNTDGIAKTGYTQMKYIVDGHPTPTGSNGFQYTDLPTLKVQYCVGGGANGADRYAGQVLAHNPISYWPLNESSGSSGTCDVQGRNHGQLYGGVTPGQTNAVAQAAMSFNGSGHVGFAAPTLLQPTAALSVEGWIKTTAMGLQTVMRSRLSGYGLYLQDGKPTAFACGAAAPCAESLSGSFAYKLQGSSSVADDRWHHLVLTKDAATSNLYVDGVVAQSIAHTEPVAYAGTGIAIGRDGDAASYTTGSIDEVAVYGYALTAAQVQAHSGSGPGVTAQATRGGAANAATNLKCSQQNVVAPVSTGTGNFWHTFSDLSVPGRGPGLNVTRTYNSAAARPGGVDGPFGPGWSSSYQMRAEADPSGAVRVVQEDGSEVRFVPFNGGYWAPSWVLATLVKNADGTYSFTRKAREIFDFAASGRLSSIKDLNGYTTTLSYDSSDRLVSVAEPAGRTLSWTWAGSRVAQVVDSAGRTVDYGYDAAAQLTSVTDVTGGITRFSYLNGLMKTMTDPRGGVVTNTFDSSDRVVSQTDPLLRLTTFDYTSVPGSTKVTSPAGVVTLDTYQYGQLVTQTTGYGTAQAATTTRAYNPATLGCSTVTDPNNRTTTKAYDARGNLTSRTDPLGRQTTWTYDNLNNVTSERDAKLVTTTMTYDAKGNLLTRSRPLLGAAGATSATQKVTFNYGENGNPNSGEVTSMLDPNGQRWAYAYDTYGNRTSTTDPLYRVTTAAYDTLGRKTSTVSARGTGLFANPAAYTTSYAYDWAGRLTRVTDPLGGVTVRRYDRNGNLDLVTDADNRTTTYDHDAADQPTVVHRPDTSTVGTAYDLDGRVTRQVDGANAATLYGYDPLGRLATVTDPQGRTTTYGHDPAGNITTKQDPGGNCTATPKTGCTTFGYDAADQQTTISYSEGATPNVTVGYNALGQRTSMTDGTGTSTWTWDSLGRLVSSSTGSGLVGGAQTVGYAYDLRNSKTSTNYPGNKTVPRVYDAAGNLTSTTDWTGTASTFGYDADDNLISRSAQGLDTGMAYDANSRVTAINVGYALLFSTSTQSYGRTPTGQLTSTSGSGSMTESNSYTYTGLNQLKTANGASYAYDPADNLTGTITGGKQTFDVANQLCWTDATTNPAASCTANIPTGATRYGYDNRGNRTSKTPYGGPASSYGYDQADRMTSATGPPPGTQPQYPQVGDFDGNSTKDRAVFHGGNWHIEGQATLTYGTEPGDLPVAADYDGDRKTDLAVFRPSTGTWHVKGGQTTQWGTNGDIPASGDYDGDGKTDLAVLRPSNGTWYLYVQGGQSTQWGTNGDVPVPGDYDGDGKTDLAVFRPSNGNWFVKGGLVAQWGITGDIPVPADFNGDGKTDVAVYRPSTGTWFVKDQFSTVYGTQPGDIPVPADYNGDNTADLAVYRHPTTTWYTQNQATITLGPTINTPTTTYTYNGDGLRLSKTVGTTTTTYTWDQTGALPLLLSETTNGATTRYIYGTNDRPIEQIGPNGVPTYLHYDQIGSVRMLTQTGTGVVATFTYDPYGKKTASTGTVTTPFGFAGQYTDPETGFIYLRNRYYDPTTGNFLTRDPIEGLTRSAYGYVGGNPLNLTDPLGLAPWDWAGDAVRSTRAFLSEHTDAMHFVINVGVGIAAGAAAAAICAGTAGLGCLIFAGAAVGMAVGTVAHHAGALAACEEITVGKSLGWVASSAWAGGTGGVYRGAWGRGLGTGGPLRPKPGTPGLQGLAKQPFWSDPVRPTYGGWHGGFRW